MDILFINVGGIRPVDRERGMRPLSLLYLSSYLLKNGYTAKIIDLSALEEEDKYTHLESYLLEHSPQLVGFGVYGPHQRFNIFKYISTTAKLLPNATILGGGNFFTQTASDALKNIPELDIVVRGEGEEILLELMQHFDGQKSLEEIKGITYRDGDEIKCTETRKLSNDIDQFIVNEEVFAHIHYPGGKYTDTHYLRNYESSKLESVFINVGRGCPGKCIFCTNHQKKYRSRTIDSVIREVKDKKSKYNCNNFLFDDPFLAKRGKYFKEFCQRIIEEELNIGWYMESRADIAPELLPMAAEAGCISLDIGLESASNKILKNLNKGIVHEDAQRTLDIAHGLGIRCKVFVMVGCPGETYEDATETMRFVYKNSRKLWNTGASRLFISPGSTAEAMAKEKGLIPEDYDWYDPTQSYGDESDRTVPVWREFLSGDDIRAFRKDMMMQNNAIEWEDFLAQRDWPRGSKVALYTASGGSDEFYEAYNALDDKPFELVCAFDREKVGEFHGLPIYGPDKITTVEFDKIIIPSKAYYYEVKELLESLGMKEFDDFCHVFFSLFFARKKQ